MSTSIQRSPGTSSGGGGAGWNTRTSAAAIHSAAPIRYAVGLPALSTALSRSASGVRAAIWRLTPPPCAVYVVYACPAPQRGDTNPSAAVSPVSSPSRTPPNNDGWCSVIAAASTYSLSFLSILQYSRPPTVTSSYCRTLTEPTSGLSSTMWGGTAGTASTPPPAVRSDNF